MLNARLSTKGQAINKFDNPKNKGYKPFSLVKAVGLSLKRPCLFTTNVVVSLLRQRSHCLFTTQFRGIARNECDKPRT